MRISENGRYLSHDDGTPFFYLADTSWGLFYNVSLEEVEHYLRVRSEQGFTVIMPVLVWFLECTDQFFGRRPFVDNDPARPNEAFFAHVDRIVERANALGLTVALLPSWGSYVAPARSEGGLTVLTPDNGRGYGEFLGRRYRDMNVLWVLGGDRNPQEEAFMATWRQVAAGLRNAVGNKQLLTYHPMAVYSSSQWVHEEPWLDLNMLQTSTRTEIDYCATLLSDYNRQPTKPFVDGETRYEHSFRYFWGDTPRLGVRMTPQRVRQAAYYAILCGALGHTYGCRDVWSFHVPSDRWPYLPDVDTHWKEALHFPVAEQLRHLRRLFADYPWHRLLPDQRGGLINGSMEGNLRIQGAVADDGSFAVIYVPDDMAFCVDLNRLEGSAVDARWFDPVTGQYRSIQRFHDKGVTRFHLPGNGQGQDHLLVLSAV